MDPTREPRSTAAEPATPRDILPDDAVVAFLRARAPGLPTVRFDGRAVTSRARRVLRRRLRLRNSFVAMVCAATAYLALALAGPLPVPGVGTLNLPGGSALRGVVAGLVPGAPPGPGEWRTDVDRLDTEVRPVVERLRVYYYLLESGPSCRVLEYPRGAYRDGAPDCGDLVPFDAQARADFDAVTDAVKRSGVAVERIFGDGGGIHVQLEDYSWQYNWAYVYLPDTDTPPAIRWPAEQWTHIQGDWWFHRAHDD